MTRRAKSVGPIATLFASRRRWAAPATLLAGLLALAGCGSDTRPAAEAEKIRPALWRVEDGSGRTGWLFGTIHRAERPLAWDTPEVRQAFDKAGAVMVEVGNLADEGTVAATFSSLARSEGEPPLSERIDPAQRERLARLLKEGGHRDGDFTAMDTWAAALVLARTGSDDDETRNGVDRAVVAAAGKRPVLELEGAQAQLSLFDSLPEKEQRDLLSAIVAEADTPDRDLTKTWMLGDMTAIEAETRTGLLADPELRAVLFTGRNRVWTQRIGVAVRQGQRPFVAVGAAHMAGPEGLPAMLAREGFTVTRVQ